MLALLLVLQSASPPLLPVWERAAAAAARRGTLASVAPRAVRQLPPTIRDVLQARGCRIPESGIAGDRMWSVAGGHFTAPHSNDWAVLCLAGGATRIIVFRAGSGEVFAERVPDVVVSDVAMPEKTGYELVQAIRPAEPGAGEPVIAVTASGLGGDRERALSAGFDDYLRKPVEPRELVAAVHAWARKTR